MLGWMTLFRGHLKVNCLTSSIPFHAFLPIISTLTNGYSDVSFYEPAWSAVHIGPEFLVWRASKDLLFVCRRSSAVKGIGWWGDYTSGGCSCENIIWGQRQPEDRNEYHNKASIQGNCIGSNKVKWSKQLERIFCRRKCLLPFQIFQQIKFP